MGARTERPAPGEQVPVARSAPGNQQAVAVSDSRGGEGGVKWGAPGTTQGSGGFWVGTVFLPRESWSLCPCKPCVLLCLTNSHSVPLAKGSPQVEASKGGVHSHTFQSPSPTLASSVSLNLPWPSPTMGHVFSRLESAVRLPKGCVGG